jgi:exportin-1
MQYLVKISEVNDPEIFKICLECWNTLTRDLYQTECRAFESSVLNTGGGMFGGGGASGGQRKVLYEAVLAQVRKVLIERMAKPEEVLVVEGDAGTSVACIVLYVYVCTQLATNCD